ncbi:MAG: glycerol kinase GlpK [Proteobacteria bacterium]|nr:glycerol kinase GlpK [Pseudomonadota bacterium]
MAGPHILSIDQGTTSTRAVVFDVKGAALATAQKPFRQIFPRDGWVEHDPEDIWQTTVDVCRAAIEAAGGAAGIATIGITNQRETTVVWDKRTHRTVGNAIVWQDRRGAARCEELRGAGKTPLIQKKTGLLIDSYFSATKLEWILNQSAEVRLAAEAGHLAFGTIDTFLLWRLTGGRTHASDATNASRTMLYDIHRGAWDEELLALFNVPRKMLPDVRDTAASYGETDPALFGRAIPITAVVGDQQGALVGQACFEPGSVKSTYGTGCFVLVNTGARALTSKHRLLTTVAYRLKDATTYALEGSIFNAGTVIQWLRDGAHMIESSAESEALAASLDDAAPSNVYFVPAFTGLGAPYWDPNARGAILGLTRDSGRAQIVRAALESVCFQTNDLLSALQQDGINPPPALRVDGGMVTNKWLMRMLADVTGLTVERPVYGETTVLGAAFLAGLGAGIFASPEEIKTAWKLDFSAHPRLTTERRDAMLAGWREAVGRVLTPPRG